KFERGSGALRSPTGPLGAWVGRAGSRRPVSRLSAAIPYAASRRTAVPGSVPLLSRADVVPCRAATGLAKGRAWPDTEEVTGSNPVAPTTILAGQGPVST